MLKFEELALSAVSAVSPNAPLPNQPRQTVQDHRPKQLQAHTVHQGHSALPSQVNLDGKINLASERRKNERLLQARRQQVQWKHEAPSQPLKGEHDEGERRDFENPEGERGGQEGHQELVQSAANHGKN